MHSSFFEDVESGTHWAFHHNGDPLPGDVLINQRHLDDWQTFRTTAEEIMTFLVATKVEADPPILTLRTTAFVIENPGNPQWVLLRAVFRKGPDDAQELKVPRSCLESFGVDLIREKFLGAIDQMALTDRFLGAVGMSLFLLNTPS